MKKLSLILLSLLLILLSGCNKTAAQCHLCGAPASDYPCVVELSTGNIAEIKAADYGTASFSSSGGIVIRSMDTDSATALLPTAGEPVNRSLFCDNCLALLDNTPNSGYVLADLHNPSHVSVFCIKDGVLLDILGYSLSVDTDDSKGNLLVTGKKT